MRSAETRLKLSELKWSLPAIAAALAFHAPLAGAAFVWDDIGVQTLQLPWFRTFSDAFFPPAASGLQTVFFRPLVWLSYMADRALAPTDSLPAFAHTANLLFHALAVFLLYLLARELFARLERRDLAASGAALLFAVNPVHAESIAAISGRTDILATLFILATLYLAALWHRGTESAPRRTLGYAFAAASVLLLALLSKEVAIALLALLPALLIYLRAERRQKRSARDYALFAAPPVVALIVWLALRSAAGIGGTRFAALSLPAFFSNIASALGFYLRKTIIPWPQVIFAQEMPALAASLLTLFGALALAAFVWKRNKEARPLTAFASAWFFASIAPSLTVAFVPNVITPVAERYLYLPSVATALLLGWSLARADLKTPVGKALVATLAIVAVAYAASSYSRTGAWKSDKSFWTELSVSPESSKASYVWSNLGVVTQKEGDDKGAALHFRKAFDLAGNDEERRSASFNLTTSLINLAKSAPPGEKYALATEAAAHLEKLAALTTKNRVPTTLARALYLKAEAEAALYARPDRVTLEKAYRYATIAIAVNPADIAARATLADVERLAARYR